jgi:hypothetical protein
MAASAHADRVVHSSSAVHGVTIPLRLPSPSLATSHHYSPVLRATLGGSITVELRTRRSLLMSIEMIGTIHTYRQHRTA